MLHRKADRLLLLVTALYFLSSLLQGPVSDAEAEGVMHLRIGDAVLSPPMVLSGDSPHYLVVVNSLIEDWDFDVSNNYDQAERGDWDTGARFRRDRLDHHVDQGPDGRQYSYHAPFLPMMLAPFVLPLRGTRWVEPACIWIVMTVTLAAIWYFGRKTGDDARWAALLALGTPLWCYARDLWTEPWAAAAWIGVLFCESLPVLAILAFLGTLIRYPLFLPLLVMAGCAFWQGDKRRAIVLIGSSTAALFVAIGVIQLIFSDVGHFSLLHFGAHVSAPGSSALVGAPFSIRFDGLFGLLGHPKDGLLPFFPFLIWGFLQFRKGGYRYLPAVAFFLLNASYDAWGAGTGFSARYLLPMIPVLILAVQDARPRDWLFKLAVLWSLGFGFVAGIYPALAYDRSPWQMIRHVWLHLEKQG